MADFDDDIYDEEYADEDEWREALEERRWAREQNRVSNGHFRQILTESAFVAGPDYVKPQYAKETPWLVEGFLPTGSLTILGATSKSGKTCLATALAMAVAKGEPFLGMETRQTPILWCAFEESRVERWRLMSHFGDPPPNFYTSHADLKIDDDFGLEVFEWWIDQLGQPLIVIDPLFGATDGNLADGRAARRALIGLKRRAGVNGATVLILHHVNKDVGAGHVRERFAESNQLLATASMDLLMDSRDLPDGSREIRLQGRGRGDFANRTWLIRSTGPADFQLMSDVQPGETKGALRTGSVVTALQQAGAPMTVLTLAERCGMKTQTLRNLLAELLRSGQIVEAGHVGRQKTYALNI